MNEWVRSPQIEDSYQDLHQLRPQVYFAIPQERNKSIVKLVLGGKEIIIEETLERGLTKNVLLKYNGEVKKLERVFEAEQEANKILRS